jgi:hypothetical protein
MTKTRRPSPSRRRPLALLLGVACILGSAPARAVENTPHHDATDLAKATQNPVGDLMSVPLQFNYTSGGDLDDRVLSVFNLQPVFPLPVTESVNLIARTIVPIINTPVGVDEREKGIGDIQEQLFFTPAKPGKFIWGVGPILSLPTATNDAVSTGEFGIGPNFVGLTMHGPWVIGALANNLWRFAGDTADPDMNIFTTQIFVNYNLPRGWAFSTAPIITANWSAPEGEEWTVPVGLGISKVTAIGKQPVNLGLQYYNNVERPDGTGEHTVRLVTAFLFPVAK